MPLQAQRGGGGTVPIHSQPITRRMLVDRTTFRPLYPWKRPGIHFSGYWMGLRAGLDGIEYFTPPEFDTRNVQPAASRCNCYANSSRPSTTDKLKLIHTEQYCYPPWPQQSKNSNFKLCIFYSCQTCRPFFPALDILLSISLPQHH